MRIQYDLAYHGKIHWSETDELSYQEIMLLYKFYNEKREMEEALAEKMRAGNGGRT